MKKCSIKQSVIGNFYASLPQLRRFISTKSISGVKEYQNTDEPMLGGITMRRINCDVW